MARPNWVSKSYMLEDGVCVWFGEDGNDESYYAHGILLLDKENCSPADNTMHGWIQHMEKKVWWNKNIEAAFVNEVKKYL